MTGKYLWAQFSGGARAIAYRLPLKAKKLPEHFQTRGGVEAALR